MAESPSDLVMMAGITADVILNAGITFSPRDAIELAGGILCFIFESSKPLAYRTRMTEARGVWEGLARDRQLQDDFREMMESLASQGALNSLVDAVQAEVWDAVGRGSPLRA